MDIKYTGKKSGVTLVELLIAIAILSIVLTGIYSLFSYGNKTYGIGTTQYDIQSSIRFTIDTISKDVRYAEDVEFLKPIKDDDAFDNNYIYVYLTQDKRSIKMKKKGSSTPVTIAGGKDNKSTFELYFERDNTDKLKITIKANQKSESYEVKSSIKVLNIHLGSTKEIDITYGENVDAIRYIREDTANSYIYIGNLPLIIN